jgi:hypothetical protein
MTKESKKGDIELMWKVELGILFKTNKEASDFIRKLLKEHTLDSLTMEDTRIELI